MNTPNNDTLEIGVKEIAALIYTLKIQEVFPGSVEMHERKALSDLLKAKLDQYERRNKTPQQWDIVEPKTGKNNFRAGNTAYGRAVLLYPDEGTFVSEDGKFVWKGFNIDHHVVVGRLSMDDIVKLNASHGRYPIIG